MENNPSHVHRTGDVTDLVSRGGKGVPPRERTQEEVPMKHLVIGSLPQAYEVIKGMDVVRTPMRIEIDRVPCIFYKLFCDWNNHDQCRQPHQDLWPSGPFR